MGHAQDPDRAEIVDIADDGGSDTIIDLTESHRHVRAFRRSVGMSETIEDSVAVAGLAQALITHAGSR